MSNGRWPAPERQRGRWRIGYASFADYMDSDELYLETVWGGLWARGKRVRVAGGAVRVVRELWASSNEGKLRLGSSSIKVSLDS